MPRSHGEDLQRDIEAVDAGRGDLVVEIEQNTAEAGESRGQAEHDDLVGENVAAERAGRDLIVANATQRTTPSRLAHAVTDEIGDGREADQRQHPLMRVQQIAAGQRPQIGGLVRDHAVGTAEHRDRAGDGQHDRGNRYGQ